MTTAVVIDIQAIPVSIREQHSFSGEFPDVPSYSHINKDMLYEGDTAPFHVTLKILHVGRVSRNGLLYDEELVTEVISQLQSADGWRGHLSEDEAGKFPMADALWIGHVRQGDEVWAKAYIPPGAGREDLRRRKATGRKIGTSIYGMGVVERVDQTTYRLRNFELESLDLLSHGNASLQNGGDFKVTFTRESAGQSIILEKEGKMPTEGTPVITVGDVPQSVQEQIVANAQVKADAAQVKQMREQLDIANNKVKEAEERSSLYATLTARIPSGTDANVFMTDALDTLTQLRERFGTDANIMVTIDQMYSTLQESQRREFEGQVDAAIAEATQWRVNAQQQPQLEAFRTQVKRAAVAQIGEKRDVTQVKPVVKTLMDGDFKLLAEMAVKALGGPAAMVGTKETAKSGGQYKTDDELAALKKSWGIS